MGDMDISKLIEKPANRKEIITLSKPEEKISEILDFFKKTNINRQPSILGLSVN